MNPVIGAGYVRTSLIEWARRLWTHHDKHRMRTLARAHRRIEASTRGGRVIGITSGKGGTGKSVFTTNLAVQLASTGSSVTLLDADLGLANAHLMLGLAPSKNLWHLLTDRSSLRDMAVRDRHGVNLVSGGSGITEIATLAESDLFRLIRKLENLRKDQDFVLIDTSAGIGPQSLMFLYATREIILVTTPDLTSMTDGYAMIKTLFRRSMDFQISVLVNRVASPETARRTFDKLQSVTTKFIPGARLRFLGFLNEDPSVPLALARREPAVRSYPRSPVGRGIRIVTRRILESPVASRELPHAVREILPDVPDSRPTGSANRRGVRI